MIVNPILMVASATAVLGAWELFVGRPFFGWTPWNLSERALRIYGAYSLALSLVAIALALTYPSGFAFMTYGIGVLASVTAVHLVTRRQATN